MDKNGRYRDAFIISEISSQISTNPNPKIFYYYVGQFIRLHYSLKYGISSERFGELITKFSIQVKKITEKNKFFRYCLINCWNEYNLLEESERLVFEKKGEVIFSEKEFEIYWIDSKGLEEISRTLNNEKTNKIHSFAAAFSKEIKDPIDWRKPFPKPHFKQFIFVDHIVEIGQGFWIPKVETDSLVDVGLVYFSRRSKN